MKHGIQLGGNSMALVATATRSYRRKTAQRSGVQAVEQEKDHEGGE